MVNLKIRKIVKTAEIAVSFSFEVGPRYCFEKNNKMLPFSCHAWAKYDRKFWEPYLLKESVLPPTLSQAPS